MPIVPMIRPNLRAVGSQARFLKSRKDKGVDHLFRYEDIGSFVTFLEDRLDAKSRCHA